MGLNLRALAVYKYDRELNSGSINGENAEDKTIVGWLNNIIRATSTVVDFGDPQISIVCELNENNYKLAVNNYLIYTLTGEDDAGTQQSYHTIINVKVESKNNTITIITEPIENELRNGWMRPNFSGYEIQGSGAGFWNFNGITAKIQSNNVQRRDIYSAVYLDSEIGRENQKLYFTAKDTTGLGILGGVEGSVRDYFGGEFKKQYKQGRATIEHKRQLGEPDRNFRLDTRTMARGITYTVDTSQVINGVAHYMTWQPENSPIPKYIWYGSTSNPYPTVNSLGKEYRNGSVIGKNWAGSESILGDPKEKGEAAVRSRLIQEANKWNRDNKHLNEPKVNVDVDFISLRANDQLSQFSELLKLKLGDGVLVYHHVLGLEINARVSGYEYNILTGYYDKLSLGNGTNNILNRFK